MMTKLSILRKAEEVVDHLSFKQYLAWILRSGYAEILQAIIFIEERRIKSRLGGEQIARKFWNNERKVLK
jgi:hypothetical protein